MSLKTELTKKHGPLPTYTWVVIAVTASVAFIYWRRRAAAGAATAAPGTAVTSDPSLDPTTGLPFAGSPSGGGDAGATPTSGGPDVGQEISDWQQMFQWFVDNGFIQAPSSGVMQPAPGTTLPGAATDGTTDATDTAPATPPTVLPADHSTPAAPGDRIAGQPGDPPWLVRTVSDPLGWASIAAYQASQAAAPVLHPKPGYSSIETSGAKKGQSYNIIQRKGTQGKLYANGDFVAVARAYASPQG
jgi:hypothetical protein